MFPKECSILRPSPVRHVTMQHLTPAPLSSIQRSSHEGINLVYPCESKCHIFSSSSDNVHLSVRKNLSCSRSQSLSFIVMFLAPTEAQGVTISVRLPVCPAQVCQEQLILIFLAQIFKSFFKWSLNSLQTGLHAVFKNITRRGGCPRTGLRAAVNGNVSG